MRDKKLQTLIARHRCADVDRASPGTPDLLVFRTRPNETPRDVRFVEVKRRDEELMRHQRAELAFLKAQGFKAGVVRLLERRAHGGRSKEQR